MELMEPQGATFWHGLCTLHGHLGMCKWSSRLITSSTQEKFKEERQGESID